MARTMLIENGLTKHYWVEKVNTTNYELNKCLTRPILKKNPYELYKGWKPNIAYLRPFGCKCFIHSNGKDNLGNFNARSDEGFNELDLDKHFDDVSDDELDVDDRNEDERRICMSLCKVLNRLKKNRLSAMKTHSLILKPNSRPGKTSCTYSN